MSLFVDRVEDLPGRETIASMSGLEFITAIAEGRLPAPPIARTLDYGMESVEEGRVVFRGRPSFEVMNPIGTVHGGWFGTLLDSCMACAVQTCLPKGQGYTTLEYKVNVIRPLFANSGEVRAIGQVSHVGRRTGIAEGRIEGVEDGKLYATGSTTCMVFDL
ncbi:PaaI family thioesterase [Roseobacter sp. HKCCA0434]|uniref:PaaI family thioesterase n=1 Tax=Roseobacter sp. HKCCA0434 TaxID=3079297 RepID=UPI002905E347|nr:PaaI family thioesterase [Roseobacter sp. HKCCA0434]